MISNLLKRGFTPTLKSLNQYLSFLINTQKNYTLIPHIISQMNHNHIKPNHKTHSLFILSLIKLHKFEEAEHFIKTHIPKHSKSWDFLIQSICRDDPDNALFVLQDSLRNYGVLPAHFTLFSLIRGFVLHGNMDGAIQVVELMNDENVKYPFDNFVRSLIISGFCKIGKYDLALSFFENFVKIGALKPNLVTYSAFVYSLCILGRVDEVCDVICKMEKEGLAFDVVFFSSWIYGYFRNGDLVEACSKHREMVEKGIKGDVISYSILIDGFSKEGNVEKAVGFLHKMISDGIKPNLVTYTAIMLGFCRKGKVEEALSILKLVEDIGIELDDFVYAILIDGLCLKGDFDCAFQLIEEMEKKGVSPNIVAYNTLIDRLCKAGRTSDADNVSKLIRGDKFTYSALLCGYIKEGNSTGILEVKRRLGEDEISMDIALCNIIMKALFVAGAFEDVHVLYDRMQEMSLVADSVTYSTMIDGYCKVGQIDEALRIFDKSRHELGYLAACYNSVIDGLCKNRMVEMAADLFVELNENGLPLDSSMCMTLLKAILEEESEEGVLNIFYKIENLRLSSYDATLWNFAIILLLQRGFPVAACEVYMVARRNKLALTSKSYYLIIKGLIGTGKIWVSMPILCSFLKEFGLTHPEVSKAILHYLCLKDVNNGLRFFNKMREKKAFATFPVSVLRALAKQGKFLDAYKLVVNAKDDQLCLDVVDYSITVHGLCKEGHPIKALDLCVLAAKKGTTLNIVTYNSVLSGLCSQGCFVKAFRLFDSLERIKLTPSEITYSILIDNMCKEGYFLDARQLLERMVSKGCKSNTRIYNSFINGYCKFGHFEEALKILKSIETECLQLDEFTISSMINGYCRKGNMEGALTFFLEYKAKGITPDFLGFLHLMRGLCAKGRMEDAREILREMLQSKSVMELLNRVNTEVETESVDSFLVFIYKQGSIKDAVTVLNVVASMYFPQQKWCGPSESQELQKFSESEVSRTTSSHGSTSDVINAGKLVGRSDDFMGIKSECFNLYYSEIAALCSSGELEKANLFAKEVLASWEGNC